VACCAEQLDVGSIEQLATIAEFAPVIAVDTLARAVVRRLALWILATSAALSDDRSDQHLPFA
jgi:hypothetical protein